jgi:NhaP-type Na+/H+ or K+/H+ antiporter
MITVYSKVTGSLLLGLSAANVLIPLAYRPELLTFTPLMAVLFFASGLSLLLSGFSKHWQETRKVVLVTALIYGFLAMLGFLQNDNTLQYSRDELFCLTLCVSALLFGVPETYAFKH